MVPFARLFGLHIEVDMDTEAIDHFKKFRTRIHQTLCRYLVRIRMIHSAPRPVSASTPIKSWDGRIEQRTGFLIDIDDNWYVCTAGHVIHDLFQKNPERVVVDLKIMYKFQTMYPLALDLNPKALNIRSSYSEDTGLDFGLIPLTGEQRRSMEAEDCHAFTEELFSPPIFEASMFGLMGFPKDTRIDTVTLGEDSMNWRTEQYHPLLLVEAIPDPLRESLPHRSAGRLPMFRGRIVQIPTKPPVLEVNGMSGGPIVALRVNAERSGFWCTVIAVLGGEKEVPGGREISGSFIQHLVKLHRKFE
jgi:hypothetical protein